MKSKKWVLETITTSFTITFDEEVYYEVAVSGFFERTGISPNYIIMGYSIKDN